MKESIKVLILSLLVVILLNLNSTVIAVINLNSSILQDGQPPIFDKPTYSPQAVNKNEAVTVSCFVQDVAGENESASGINSVVCEYSTDSGAKWTTLHTVEASNTYTATIPGMEGDTVVLFRFFSQDNQGNEARSETISYTVNLEDYDFKIYLFGLKGLSFDAGTFFVIIVLLALSICFIIWWVLHVFKTFPLMLSDLTGRVRESYGNIGVFIFILLFFPSLLVFIIHFMTANIGLLFYALEGIIDDLIRNTTNF
jgi:hypothetical protein